MMLVSKDRVLRFLKSWGNAIAEDILSEPEGLVVVAVVLIAGAIYLLATAIVSPGSFTQSLGSNLDALSINPDKWNFRS